ncbi:MAG TPA: acyl-CoA dehydrogenase family protein, partial [Solirubrobacteraceae bacterium]|nr:acyl-CoA dehydrogenase family protein [Solirubrobacteraceae bacterium]
SLPSSEVEFRGARAALVGEPGRGVAAIIQMVNHTRLDCLLGSTQTLRRGTVEAIHHAMHRRAFGAPLVEQPAMANVLADLALESEAATHAALRVARSYDDAEEGPFRRLATAVMKYWVTKRAPAHAAEALECLGGNGYVEDSGMPLLFRDSPLNSIWEGSGNVAALDVLRVLSRDPAGAAAFVAECERGRGADARLDAQLESLRGRLGAVASLDPGDAQFAVRSLVEDLALSLQGSLLVRHAPAAVADGFCAARLGGRGGRVYGTLPAGVDTRSILARAYPV